MLYLIPVYHISPAILILFYLYQGKELMLTKIDEMVKILQI